jgi:3-deoxy-D-manno-octulosonic-acid transferase
MTISKRTEVACARRKLRQLQEDEPTFRVRIAEMTPTGQDFAIEFFGNSLERLRQQVSQLEAELETDTE